MAARLPKIFFTTAAPTFALFRLLSFHWSSRKHEGADAGVGHRRFDRLSCGIAGLRLEQIGLPVSEEMPVELSHVSHGVPLDGKRQRLVAHQSGLHITR